MERKAKKKRCKKRPWQLKHWSKNGEYLPESQEYNPDDFKTLLGMSSEVFQYLVSIIGPYVQKSDTVMRKAFSVEERLGATLRYLATGSSFESLKYTTSISPQCLGKIIPETCDALYNTLKKEYLNFPTSTDEWIKISNNFENQWNFPNLGGVIGGRHISILPPSNSGSYFYNYKDYYSIMLLAIVNSNYEFILADVGTNGLVSDGSVLENTKFYEKLKNKTLNLPIEEDETQMKFVFIGNDTLSLDEHILTPFCKEELTEDKRIYNYRLFHAHSVVENALGVLSNRFRIFHTTINLSPAKVDKIVLSCCALHNFLRRNCEATYSPPELLDREDVQSGEIINGQWRNNVPNFCFDYLAPGYEYDSSSSAEKNRLKYLQYFKEAGAVSWQDLMVLNNTQIFGNEGIGTNLKGVF